MNGPDDNAVCPLHECHNADRRPCGFRSYGRVRCAPMVQARIVLQTEPRGMGHRALVREGDWAGGDA